MDYSVDFSGNNIYYDFLNLDISGIMPLDPSFMDLYFYTGISGYNAVANLDVSVNNFSRLFFVNVKLQDISDNSYNDMLFAMDPSGWNNGSAVSFSSATVNSSTAINPGVITSKQQIKYDLIRYYLSQITGSTNLNSLFRNKSELMDSVVSIDENFQTKIKDIITSAGGNFTTPLNNNMLTPNPGSILMNSILGEDDDGVDNFNDARKNILINYLDTKMTELYQASKANKYYFYGTTESGTGFHYPLYIDPSHVDLSGVAYHNVQFDNNGMIFYMPDASTNNAVNPKPTFDGTYTDYFYQDARTYIPIPFYDGDKIAVKLTYNPKNTTIAGHSVGTRSYKVILNLKGGSVATFIFSPVGSIVSPVMDVEGFSSTDIYARTSVVNRWNGTNWSTISSVYNTNVMKIKKHNSDIYIASYYNSQGYLSKYDGTTWSVLAGGFDPGSIADIAIIGSDIYICGNFTTVGGVSVSRIAKWNGTAWSGLGSGTDNDVITMTVNGTDLYVGGFFTTAGGVSASRIAKWNGTSWSALGTGITGTVFNTIVKDNVLYASGNFTAAGSTSANNIAKWNGTSWSAVGIGFGGLVRSMVFNGSDLYVGGFFTTLNDSTPVNRIAKWNGTTWSAIGDGVNDLVFTVTVIDQKLYVGGDFTSANGNNAIQYITSVTI